MSIVEPLECCLLQLVIPLLQKPVSLWQNHKSSLASKILIAFTFAG